MTTRPPESSAHLGRCPCGAEVRNDELRDRASYLEFRITGNCQTCQDQMFLCTNAHDPSKRFALRHGALLAHDAACEEIAALPFLFTRKERRIAWEARFIVRIGARLQPLDPQRALAPMAKVLRDHAVGVHEAAHDHDSAVSTRLAPTDVVIVLDRSTCRSVTRLPLPSRRRVAVLSDEALWSAHYGASLAELEHAWGAEPEPHHSALRTCALLGWALARIPDGVAATAPPIHAFLDAPHRSD